MEPYYLMERLMHDRLEEARALARSAALAEQHARPRRPLLRLGLGLVRLGSWLAGSHGSAGRPDDQRALAQRASH